MEFTPITTKDFPKPIISLGIMSPIGQAIRKLEVGQGFSIPCEWNHNLEVRRGCPGTMKIHSINQRLAMGLRLRTKCTDGIFYVLRIG
jgi:hypothetical protein